MRSTCPVAAARGGPVRVRGTSRQPLGLAGEAVFEVAPLPVRRADSAADGDDSAHAAVTLFEQRASAVAYGFVVTHDSRRTVVEICDRLDGLLLRNYTVHSGAS